MASSKIFLYFLERIPMTRDELYTAYPKLFRQKNLPSTESCMYWGIQCGDGWLSLIEKLSEVLAPIDGVEYSQIKEKFGLLRISLDFDDTVSSVVRDQCLHAVGMYEMLSCNVCEKCGADGIRRTDLSWISTLCDTHYNEREKFLKDYTYDGE